MQKVSGDLHIVDFKTKQIIASIQPEDYFDDLRHWEIKDNVDILDFKLLEDSPFLDYIQQKNLILKETNPGVITPYVITSIEKDSEAHNVTIYASGEWILLDKENYIKPQEIKSWSAEQYLTLGIIGTGWEIGLIEAEGKRSFKIEKFISPLQFVQQIATLFNNIEIQYRIEIGTGKPRRFIDLVKKRGRETNKEVTLGKDLVGIKRIENSENIITALVPYYIGQDTDGNDKLITIESVNNGSQYIIDDAAFQRWNVNGKHLFGFYTPESEKDELTPARLLTLAKMELKKRISAIVTYEVNSVDISSVFGYEHEDVSEGDTIRIIDEGMTPTLYLEARAIAGDESHKDKHQNKLTFGNYVEIVDQDEALRKLYQQMLSKIQDKVPASIFESLKDKVNQQGSLIDSANKKSDQSLEESKAAKDIANASLKYAKDNTVDIIEQATPPTANLKDGKTLWSDSSDPNNKVLKLWKGGAWVIVSPDTKVLNTALTQAQNDITKAKQDIITGQNALTSAKSELQGNINTEKQRITDLTTTVGKKVDKTWIDQQLLDKADKSGVYDRDYIDKNTVGKQTYETDKAGNVQKFTDMSTEIQRNAQAITSKAEASTVTNLGNDLTSTKNRVTTVEQTATGLTTRIGTAEGKINTATGNITDLQTKTNTIEQTAKGSVQKIEELTGRFDGMSIGSVNMIQGTEEIFNNPSATGNFNGFKVVPSPHPKYDLRNKELTISVYFTGKITAKGTNPWLGMELGFTFMDNTTQYLNGRIDSKITLNQDYLNERFVFVVKVNDKEIKSVNVTQGARDLTGSIKLFKGQIEEGNKVTAWKLSPEELTTTQQFTQKTNEIINTVDTNAQKLTAVETTMKNAKYGRDNLIPNSGMFSNTGGWMANTPANSTMEVVTEDGFNAMKIKGSIRASSPIILKPDTEYVYSALIKIPVDNVVSEGSGNPLHFWSTIGANPHTAVQRTILEPASKKILANTWTRVSYKFKTLAGAENTLFTPFMYSQEIINSNAFAYIRYFQLVEGNQITEDWQAPSGDTVKKTNEIVQTIDSTISRVTAVESRRTGSDNLLKVGSAKQVLSPKNTGAENDNYNFAQLPIEMQMDRTYTISARVKFTAGTDTHITVYPYTNGSQQHIEIKDGYISHTFKKINVATTSILLYAGKAGTTRSKGVEFTEIMVTEGDAPVSYAPPSPTLDVFTNKTNEIISSVDATRQRISAVESTVSATNDDVTNLFMDSGSFKDYVTSYNALKRWLLKGAGARISADTFQDNAVAETQSSWSSLCYNFKDLVDRGVVKVGDILNVSIYMRIKGLPAGQTKVVSYFFRGRNNAKSFNVSNTWARYDVETTVTADMLTVSGTVPESYMRFEVNENTGASAWFQQSQPQLTVGTKLYTWRTAPEDISTLVVRTNEISNTVDSNMMTITKAVQGGGENFLYKSSGEKGEVAHFHDDTAYVFNGSTRNVNNEDHIQFTCSSYSDAFYQIGATNVNLMHGFGAGETLTLSFDQRQDIAGMQTIIFQNDGTGWSESEYKTYSTLAWSHERHTFTLKANTKGWFIRFRFPRVAESNGKNIYLAKLKLQAGSIDSPWNPNAVETNRTTNTLKQGVDSLTSDLQSVRIRTGQVEMKANTLEQTTNGTVSSVNSLTQTVGQHTQQITQQGTKITQMNNEIDLRVKSSEMTDYIGKLGAENELRNTAFETKVIHPSTGIITSRTPSLDKWGGARPSGSSVVADTVRNREGYNSAKIEDLVSTTNQYCGINQSIPATISSGDYVASVWVYTDDKSKINQGAQLYLQFMNGATAVSGGTGVDISSSLVNGQWKLFTVKVTAPATAITALRFEVWVRQQGRIWVSQPMLQYGSNASAFMEHPQDYVNYDALIGEVAKKVATTDYNSKISTIESSITQANTAINLRVLATDVYKKTEADGRFGSKAIVDTAVSDISVMKGQISLKVEAGGIASAINQTAQAVLIQASKIYLDGFIEAKHLKAQELVGVTIKTAPNTEDRYVKLNRQFLEMYDKNTSRVQLRFTNSPFGTAITPTLIMGNSSTRGIVGASQWQHWTYLKLNGVDEDPTTKSMTVIGVIDSYNGSTNNFTYGSQIRLYESGAIHAHGNDLIWIKADKSGYIKLETTTTGGAKPIIIDSSQYFQTQSVTTTNINVGTTLYVTSGQAQNFESGNGQFNFSRKGLPSNLNQTMLQDDGNNADLRLAFVRIRSSHVSGYDGKVQFIPTGQNVPEAGIEAGNISYKSLTNRSSRSIKCNIRDLGIDSLEKIMTLKVQQYNFKSDVEKLYNMRQSTVGTDKVYTTNDIPLQYGLILEDTDETFHSDFGDGINLYTLVSLNVDSTQKIKRTQDIHEEEISNLKSKVATQEERIAKLEELLLQQLINKKPEQP
ncbi:phage tail spike protein [Bacillus cereus]|uniref:phage tail spike protein n=1 Tax=Bacillus cereus TaxID=1396 RepID=UPI00210C485E|nr:phage tail spike protein [Bacillus cereus]